MSDMTKRFKVLASVLFLTLAGCNSVGTVQKIAPFPDRPEQYHSFQYTPVNVTGIVWLFEKDGTYVNHHGPVGAVNKDEDRVAISISGTNVELLDAYGVVDFRSEDVRSLMTAADKILHVRRICSQSSWPRRRYIY